MEVFVTLIGVALFILGDAWVLMITVGILHHQWWHVIPTMSYSAAFAAVLPVVLFSVFVKWLTEQT